MFPKISYLEIDNADEISLVVIIDQLRVVFISSQTTTKNFVLCFKIKASQWNREINLFLAVSMGFLN